MKKFIIFSLLLGCLLSLHAQGYQNRMASWQKANRSKLQKFEKDNDARLDSFDIRAAEAWKRYIAHRDSANAVFVSHMRQAWDEFSPEAPEEMPVFIDPPMPQECSDSFLSDIIEYIADKVVILAQKIVRKPKPFIPCPKNKTQDIISSTTPSSKQKPIEAAKPIVKPFHFDYYGTDCSVRLDESLKFTLDNVQEGSVADMWMKLSKGQYDLALNDCLWLRDSLQLCSWGYYAMLRMLSEDFLGADSNESTLLTSYLFIQSGYKMRIGRSDNQLIMMIPTDYKIYSRASVVMGDIRYYIFGPHNNLSTFSTLAAYTRPYQKEEVIVSLRVDTTPLLAENHEPVRTFTSNKFPDVSVKVAPNHNLIEFYNDYPVNTNWPLYSLASLSPETKESLEPLKKYIQGKSEQDAAAILLDFVQTGFNYAEDGKQFGYERPLFGDETFYYPFSDCEDRSILFSILVREYLGLDVVFIYYPQHHLSTAVRFHDPIRAGAQISVNGETYTMCDPTYINAGIGRVMDTCINRPFEVVMIK